jgi:hypothetical protein
LFGYGKENIPDMSFRPTGEIPQNVDFKRNPQGFLAKYARNDMDVVRC